MNNNVTNDNAIRNTDGSMNNGLKGKVVVITGASSGFGKGAALRFAREGASVVLAARRADLLDELVRECQGEGGRAVAAPTDVGKQEDVENLARTAMTEFGRIDVWVNNAGVGALGRFDEVPLEDHVRVIETDLLGTIFGSYYAMRQFRRQGQGTLINISSVLGKLPAPYYGSYAAAKHGVVGLGGVLRQELAENNEENIHICTVMPTSMDTPFFDHAANYTGHEVQPIPPLYEPEKVVDTIVRLATDPEDEVAVGTAGKIFTVGHNIAPGLVEKMMGSQTQKAQIEQSPPAAATHGSVREPMERGTEVSGGRLKSDS